MSYISAILKNNEVLVWERDQEGQRVEKYYKPPYYFYIDDEDGKYTTIYNTQVSKCQYKSSFEYYNAKKTFRENDIRMWESDITPITRILTNHYYNKPAPDLNITFLDIEVDYDAAVGFSTVENPYAPINSVALYHYYNKKLVVICVPPNNNEQGWDEKSLEKACNSKLEIPSQYNTEFYVCQNEKELLVLLLDEMQNSDVLCGWNSELFDMPYITKRVEIVLGDKGLKKLSFAKGDLPKYYEVEVYNNLRTKVELSGRISADYMDLYKKYEPGERASYSLEAISDIVLVDEKTNEPVLPKLEYEGTLYSLYREDFAFFVRYNIRDCEILNGFEERLGYVGVANLNYHISCGQFTDVFGTLRLAELALTNYCHHTLKRVVNDVQTPKEDKQISGALVLYPKVGLHEMVGSIDVGSLYPNVLRCLNGSPEKIVGQFLETEEAFAAISTRYERDLTLEHNVTHKHITKTTSEWVEWMHENKCAISGYGTVFDQSSQGFIPAILSDWITERKKYQALKKEAEKQKDYNMVGYYDRLQYVFKIKLNSLYGALTNMYFRYYDLRLGESTTCSGRAVVKHQCRKANELLGGSYDVDFPTYLTPETAAEAGHLAHTALHGPKFNGKYQAEHIIGGDTDSTYFATSCDNIEDAIRVADDVAEKVNASFPAFMSSAFLCQPEFNSFIKTGREVVSDKGIFVEKKRYILHLVDVEGKRCDKMKVMGLDTKKTTLPKHVSDKLNNLIGDYLKGDSWDNVALKAVEFKDWLQNDADILLIGLPKGVKNVTEYTLKYQADKSTNLPGHVAASIFYNICIEQYGDHESLPITSGTKIKVFYLKHPVGRFKSIALPTDTKRAPNWFLDNFEIDMKAHLERLVDNPLQNIVKAIGKQAPSRHTILVDSVLEF